MNCHSWSRRTAAGSSAALLAIGVTEAARHPSMSAKAARFAHAAMATSPLSWQAVTRVSQPLIVCEQNTNKPYDRLTVNIHACFTIRASLHGTG